MKKQTLFIMVYLVAALLWLIAGNRLIESSEIDTSLHLPADIIKEWVLGVVLVILITHIFLITNPIAFYGHGLLGELRSPVMITDTRIRTVWVNRSFEELTGYSLKEMKGRNPGHVLQGPDSDQDEIERIRQAIKEVRYFRSKILNYKKNHEKFWIEIRVTPLFKNRKHIGFVAIENDISHEQSKEWRLNFINDALNEISELVWTADPEGKSVFFNRAWKTFSGKSYAELKEKNWTALLHPEDKETSCHNWLYALHAGQMLTLEHRLRRHDGSYCWYLTRIVPQINRQGRVLMWVGNSTNIHDNKLVEEQKDEFISIASHELKTPLTSLKVYLQLLVRFVAQHEKKMQELIDKAAASTNRLDRLINDLLNVSRINLGRLTLIKDDIDFAAVLKECIDNVMHAYPSHHISYIGRDHVRCMADRSRIEQVIINLLNNAIKYSPEAKEVIVNTEVVQNNLICSVKDFGIGIEQDKLKNLFERFYRVEKDAQYFQGLGLGLYIASNIIKKHGGNIWVESTPGAGSLFQFLIPLTTEPTEVSTDNNTYYRDEYVDIEVQQEKCQVYVAWKGYQNHDSVQRGCNLMLEFLKRHNCQKVINDNSMLKGNWFETAEWAKKEWLPMAIEAGLKYFAWVYPQHIFSQLAATMSVDEMKREMAASLFANVDEAQRWLDSVSSSGVTDHIRPKGSRTFWRSILP